MKYLLTIILFITSIKSTIAQHFNYHYGEVKLEEKESGIFEDKFGICFEISMLLLPYENVKAYRNRYSIKDSETNIVEIGNFEIEIAEKQSGWVKQKVDRNCLSSDPNDCFVWCAVNAPKRIIDIKIIDEEELIDVSVLYEAYRNLLLTSGFVIYSEINCEIDNNIMIDVSKRLNKYFNESIQADELYFFLNKFQYENNLPIGGLNAETLFELEVI